MKRWILPLLLAAGLAIAGTVNITDTYIFQALFKPWSRTTAQLPTASAYTGYMAYDSTKGALTVSNGSVWVSSGLNALAPASRSYDFPALSGTDLPGTLQCARSFNLTVTGAAIGDGCIASSNFGVDGGALLPGYVHVTCTPVAANAVAFDLCVQMSDGGTYDAPDGGYTARVLH